MVLLFSEMQFGLPENWKSIIIIEKGRMYMLLKWYKVA